MDFKNAKELLELCQKQNLPISETTLSPTESEGGYGALPFIKKVRLRPGFFLSLLLGGREPFIRHK